MKNENKKNSYFYPNASKNVAPEIVSITSGKGGVGKTVFAVNLGILLGRMNYKVLLIDADLYLGNVDVAMGITPKATINDIFKGTKNLEDVIMKTSFGIDILPATSGILDMIKADKEVLTNLSKAFDKFHHNYDYVLIDTAAGIAESVLTFLQSSDKVVLVATPEPASFTDVYAVIKILSQQNKDIPLMMIVNKVNTIQAGQDLFNKMNLIVEKFLKLKLKYGGAIMNDPQILYSTQTQNPIVQKFQKTPSIYQMQLMTHRIINMEKTPPEKRGNFFERFKKHREIPNQNNEGISG